MRTSHFFLLVSLALTAQAQSLSEGPGALPPTTADPNLGPHHRRVWVVTSGTNEHGQPTLETNSFIHLQAGLNVWSERDQQWVEASDEIEVFEGGAIARHAQHRVIFSPSPTDPEGNIDLVMPGGKRLRTAIRGLAFTDRDQPARSVFVAEPQDRVGKLVARNEIVYEGAFGALADVKYTMSVGSLEQDVILRSQLEAPEAWGIGLQSESTLVEIWSEVLEADAPTLRTVADGQEVDFGGMKLGWGRTFGLPSEETAAPTEPVPVNRQWLTAEGRSFIVEAMPYTELEPLLRSLPLPPVARKPDPSQIERLLAGRPGRTRPLSLAALRPAPEHKIVASVTQGVAAARPGVVWDYTLLNSGNLTNYQFRGTETYFVASGIGLVGTNTQFSAGAVLKFTNSPTARLNIETPVTWLGSEGRPVHLTSKDDNSIGQTILGSLGNPGTNRYGSPMLYFNSLVSGVSSALRYVRCAYANTAIEFNGGTNHSVSHVQIVNAGTGLKPQSASEVRVLNGLFHNVGTVFGGSSATVRAEHLTVHQADVLNGNNPSQTVYLTNCLLVCVGNTNGYSGVGNYGRSDDTGVFQAVGAGGHYLASDTYQDLGTSTINPMLARELKTLTTDPPVRWTNAISSATTFTPLARRDADQVDVGYHAVPLDVLLSNVVLSASLTLTNGVAVGLSGSYGLDVGASAQVISEGSPQVMNRVATLANVQEQPLATGGGTFLRLSTGGSARMDFRFTDLSVSQGKYGTLFYSLSGEAPFERLSLRDCWLRGGYYGDCPNTSSPVTVSLTNNLVESCNLYFHHYYGSLNTPLSVNLYNNFGQLGVVWVLFRFFGGSAAN